MTNKRIQKLIQNIRRSSRGQDSSNRRQDGDDSQEITSKDASETQNGALQSPQEEDFYEEGDDEVVCSPPRQQNRRGRTVMKDVHELHPDDFLLIIFNERGQRYGDLQPVLANYVGTIARNGTLLPLSFLDWRKKPKNRLEEAWKLVIILCPFAQFLISWLQKFGKDYASIGKRMSDVFGLEHSGRVRCLGAGATPSQVFPDQCRRSSFYRPNDNSAADVTENLRAMEEKMKKDMEAREAQWREEMEAQKAQLQIEIERMRQKQEQFQAFARVIQNIIPGTGGGFHGPEILPAQLTIEMTNIVQKYMHDSSIEKENDGRTRNED
ncbi:hypothetical protein F511_18575 [Dorcoceras hygrometricum]|uniref:Uncharacterized protein n=1 Tax=Dorcoceras hygrometricum TaxID=472368 RepID=A0A2Z7AQ02_9LAMI|nr:hypothetical protein F511_18575 [Dorcoceras hygrometricum]